MNFMRSVSVAVVSALSAATSLAAEPLTTIDSEQKAAASLVTVNTVDNHLYAPLGVVSSDANAFAYEVLMQLQISGVTAAALRAMPDGLTRTCANGGSQTVRMPRSLPRVLNIEWNNCQVVRWITWDVTTGPGQITLFSDDFLPKHVAGIRLGNSTRDVIVKTDEQFGEDAYHTISTQNVRMTGVIPMFVGNFVEDTYIPSAIEITGFLNDAREIVYADPGRATNHDESSTLADKVLILGMSAWLQEGLYNDEDQYLVRGKFTYSQVSQYYGRQTTHLGVDNLRVHRITDYGTWTGSHSIDGKFDYQYNDAAPAGCTGGRFSVRTRTPLNIPSLDRSNLQDAGELSVNGVVTARYYSTATIPAELPAPVNGMLLNMAVRDVGTFNYDEGNFPDPMRVAANCQ